jgi:hypothetical protein
MHWRIPVEVVNDPIGFLAQFNDERAKLGTEFVNAEEGNAGVEFLQGIGPRRSMPAPL